MAPLSYRPDPGERLFVVFVLKTNGAIVEVDRLGILRLVWRIRLTPIASDRRCPWGKGNAAYGIFLLIKGLENLDRRERPVMTFSAAVCLCTA